MNRSAKKQAHEQARKKHKHQMQEHARELANRERSKLPIWLLTGGIVIIVGFVVFMVARG